jgi:hypothetical protein
MPPLFCLVVACYFSRFFHSFTSFIYDTLLINPTFF